MSERAWQDYLGDIKHAVGLILEFSAGMRDRLIHGYDSINISLIWRTIQNDIPVLKSDIELVYEKNISKNQG